MMVQLSFTVQAPIPPQAVISALTDFTERRPDVWPQLDPAAYEVISLGETEALVREGQRSPLLWAVESYDWSEPGTVSWTASESNFCAPGSFMSARVEPTADGGSTIHFRWNRHGLGFKGKMIVALMWLTRGRPLARYLSDSLTRLGPMPPAHGRATTTGDDR